jgi:hypothetical protein
MTRSLAIEVLAASLLLLASGCGTPPTQAELVGVYAAQYPAATEDITLSANGNFTQKVTLKADGKILVSSGVWTYDSKDITFHDNLLVVADSYTGQSLGQVRSWTVILPVVRMAGQIQIGDMPSIIRYNKQVDP